MNTTEVLILLMTFLFGIWIGIDVENSIWHKRINDLLEDEDEQDKKL